MEIRDIPKLVKGAGSRGQGACWMSALNWLSGNDRWTDRAACVDPLIRMFCIALNDSLQSDKKREEVIGPHLFEPFGTAQGEKVFHKRIIHIVKKILFRVLPKGSSLGDPVNFEIHRALTIHGKLDFSNMFAKAELLRQIRDSMSFGSIHGPSLSLPTGRNQLVNKLTRAIDALLLGKFLEDYYEPKVKPLGETGAYMLSSVTTVHGEISDFDTAITVLVDHTREEKNLIKTKPIKISEYKFTDDDPNVYLNANVETYCPDHENLLELILELCAIGKEERADTEPSRQLTELCKIVPPAQPVGAQS